jgi:hypothetical protein
MTNEEKIAMKVACLQAATTLVTTFNPIGRSGHPPSREQLDGNAVECARLAGLLYTQMSANDWGVHPKSLPPGVMVPGRS